MDEEFLQNLLNIFDERLQYFEIFKDAVISKFTKDPRLNGNPPIVHSVKARIKDREHFKEKIKRKHSEADPITEENLYQRITDISGVRVLHLYQQDFSIIHASIQDQIDRQDWFLSVQDKILGLGRGGGKTAIE